MNGAKPNLYDRLRVKYFSSERPGEAAAEQNSLDALYLLGASYADSDEADDLSQMIHYYRRAADGGHAGAQCDLGYYYHVGKGVEQDFFLAAKYWTASAEAGKALSQTNLGELYLNGQGVERDPQVAVGWFQKAAAQNNQVGRFCLAMCQLLGLGVKSDPRALDTLLELTQDGSMIKLFEYCIEEGQQLATFQLGLCYEYGLGVEKSLEEAQRLYRLAVERGSIDAKGRIRDPRET